MTAAPLFLAVAGLIAQAAPAELKPFTSKDGRFTIELPGVPTEEKDVVPTAVGKFPICTFSLMQGQSGFLVFYQDYPDEILKDGPEALLDGCQHGVLQNAGGKLLKSTKLKLQDVPGRDIECEVERPDAKNKRVRCRVYLKKSRLYCVMIVGEPDMVGSERSTKILNSFKFTK